MDPRTLFYFARIKPLMAWSISSSLLGVGIAGYLTSWQGLAIFPMLLSIVAVILIQYVAHPLNDMMDYELDRQAPIEATGRVKPLVAGLITMSETKWLSNFFIIAIFAILFYLILLQPLLLIPAAYGVVALIGYNTSTLKLAYKPYSELYLSTPVNALTVFVVSYVGSWQASAVALMVSIVYGFAASSFFVSMMSMDFPTDRINGKRTTIVAHPFLRWCTCFPLIGFVLSMASTFLLISYLGVAPAIVFGIMSASIFMVLIYYGHLVDESRIQFLKGQLSNMEEKSGNLRLRQLYLAVVYAILLSSLFAILGWL